MSAKLNSDDSDKRPTGEKAAVKSKFKYKSYRERREEAAAKARAKREANIPDPWCQRKAAIGIALVLIAYAAVAFIGWVCVPMMTSDPHRHGSKARGICLLVFFVLLFAMVIWSYLRAFLSSPGFAKDYSPKVPCPPLESRPFELEQPQDIPDPAIPRPHGDLPPDEMIGEAAGTHSSSAKTFCPPTGTLTAEELEKRQLAYQKALDSETPRKGRYVPRRIPHQTPVLQPYFRWCTRCEIVKPPRAHHCRHCGTCVLKMDHHCPWVGGCVGARNYKFFVNFCFWCAIFCIYIIAATATAVAPIFVPPEGYYLEAQHIVVLCIAVVFGTFTSGMTLSHLRLVLLNLTTIEEMGFERFTRQEDRALVEAFGLLAFGKKSRTKKRWASVWGRLREEGNPWWRGSMKENWNMVFGDVWWAWMLPIKARPSHDDGLDYKLNPRFTKDGIQLPRDLWPKDLQ